MKNKVQCVKITKGYRGKVQLVQLLCPARHLIFGGYFEVGNGTLAERIEALKKDAEECGLRWRCAICGSRDLTWEQHATPFNSTEEAGPTIAKHQFLEVITRSILDSAGLTHDPQEHKRRN